MADKSARDGQDFLSTEPAKASGKESGAGHDHASDHEGPRHEHESGSASVHDREAGSGGSHDRASDHEGPGQEHENGSASAQESGAGPGYEHESDSSAGRDRETDPGMGHDRDEGHTRAGHDHVHPHSQTVVNRLAKAAGHLRSVQKMVENGRDCSEVLIQLSAVIAALNNAGKIILEDHIDTCIVEAVKDNNQQSIDDLKKAIETFIK